MQIFLNGQSLDIPTPFSLLELLEQQGYAGRRVAIEVNRAIVPKSQHGQHLLHEGDKIEIVHALGGG